MLQGSLENFSLDEVLGLLSSTSKTGRLEITGDRGAGALLFADGQLVGASANATPNGNSTEDIMFELLRFSNGQFTFASQHVEAEDDAQDMSAVLAAAESRLADWRAIESVVPSLNHIVTPAPDLPEDSVMISRDEWAALNVIAAGCPVASVCDELSLGEVEGSRRIKDLAERSLVLIGAPIGAGMGAPVAASGEASESLAADPEASFGFNERADRLDNNAVVETIGSEEEGDYSAGHGEEEALVGATPFGAVDFDASAPPSLAGVTDFESEEDSGGGILKRYLGSDS